jgi:hypothetical protein
VVVATPAAASGVASGAAPVPDDVMEAGSEVVEAALQAPTPVATVPVEPASAGASGGTPDSEPLPAVPDADPAVTD